MWMAFLIVIAFLVFGRRRSWGRMQGHRWDRRHGPELASSQRDEDVQLLEVRLARLEERLDFTEKLLMERPAKTD